MTIRHMFSTTLLLALATPAIAQSTATAHANVFTLGPEAFAIGPDVFAIAPEAFAIAPEALVMAQNDPEARAQAAQERAEAAKQRAAERAQAQAEAAAERGAGRGAGAGRGFNFNFTMPVRDPDALYDAAREAIENSQFDRALRDLDRLLADKLATVDVKLGKMDAAMYWKAYSEAKLDKNLEALETVKELTKQYAASSWVKDAKALAVEIQAANGQPVSAELQSNEELKLLALRGVMQADPDKGVPIIEKMLAGGASPRVRDRALFVLAQSRAPRARDIMVSTAKNNADPDLQLRAIRYLGMMNGSTDRDVLTDIYRSSSNTAVKRSIIQSYRMSGNVDRIIDLAKNEKDSQLRIVAIRELGMMNRSGLGSAEALVSIYGSDTSTDVRKAIVNALYMQRNAQALVTLARREKDPGMKKDIVGMLSVMKTPEATDYMLELLK